MSTLSETIDALEASPQSAAFDPSKPTMLYFGDVSCADGTCPLAVITMAQAAKGRTDVNTVYVDVDYRNSAEDIDLFVKEFNKTSEEVPALVAVKGVMESEGSPMGTRHSGVTTLMNETYSWMIQNVKTDNLDHSSLVMFYNNKGEFKKAVLHTDVEAMKRAMDDMQTSAISPELQKQLDGIDFPRGLKGEQATDVALLDPAKERNHSGNARSA